jgi:hypothetical protein
MKIGNGGTFDEEATNFLNVDLDILSRSRLEPLVARSVKTCRCIMLAPRVHVTALTFLSTFLEMPTRL